MTSIALPASGARRWHTPLSWLKGVFARRRLRVPRNLSRAQLQDAGIAWELAGYGRGADVDMLTISILESQR
jgi:hypothetical protein